MVPLDERIKADKFDVDAFDPSIIKGLSRNGKQFALPYDFGPLVIYYNHDMFEKAGVPLPAARLDRGGFHARRQGADQGRHLRLRGQRSPMPSWCSPARRARTISMRRGQLDLNNAGMKNAFAQYVALVSKEKVAPLFPASGVQSSSVANGRFTSGNVAMYVDGPWQLINIKKKANFTVGMAPVPAREAGSITLSAGSGFGIATTSAHKDEAWKAIQVMTGPDAEQYLAEDGRAFAARNDFQKYWYDVAAAGVAGAREALPAALKTAEPYVTTPNWADRGIAVRAIRAARLRRHRVARQGARHDPEPRHPVAAFGSASLRRAPALRPARRRRRSCCPASSAC